ncbi:hypothetical protein Lal_00018720 [Lupinus albus]|nr:hypothetical protein Lal_00018720 [Lupinus albus]
MATSIVVRELITEYGSCMVLAFCRRGSVIPICLYLLVGRYMKERKSGLRNESSKTKRTGLFQRITAAFPRLD